MITDRFQRDGDGNGNTPIGGPPDADEFYADQGDGSLLNLPLMLWERRWFVLAAVIICLAAAIIYLTQSTPMFRSVSRIYVERSGPAVVFETQGVMMESRNYLTTQCELIDSTPVLAAAVESGQLADLKTFSASSNPVGTLKSLVSAHAGKDEIIDVHVISPFPDDAAQVANVVVNAYVDFHSRMKRDTAAEVLRLLQKEKAENDTELHATLEKIVAFRTENGTLSFNGDGGTLPVSQQLATLSSALTEAQLAAFEAKAAYDTIQAARNEPQKLKLFIAAQQGSDTLSPDMAQTASTRNHLDLLRDGLAELEEQYTEHSPVVRSLKSKITRLEYRLSGRRDEDSVLDTRLAEVFVELARQRWVSAKTRQESIEAALREAQTQAEQLNIKSSEYVLLEKGLQRSERLSDIIHSRIQELNVTEDTGALNITILEVAQASGRPFEPKKAQVLSVGLVAGIVLGAGLAWLRDRMDQRLRSTEEIAAALGTPVLGVVPHMSDKASPAERGTHVHRDAQSHTSEAYKTVRTAVYFGVPDGKAKSLLVTSASPGEGKSTLSSNLAIAMAQAGRRTLLIDADMRKPIQHVVHDITSETGLVNVLAGESGIDDSVTKTAIEALDLMIAGPVPPNPAELLNSQVFLDTLGELERRYDQIVIDSPPVIPVTDARILSAVCDVTILVVRADKTTRKAVEQARDALLSRGAQILGALVHDVEHPRGGYGYGYYGYGNGGRYGYGYGYGSDEKRRSRSPEEEPVAS